MRRLPGSAVRAVRVQQLLRSDSEKAAAEAHAVKEAAGAYRKAKGRWSATALRALPAPARRRCSYNPNLEFGRTIIEYRLGLSTIRLSQL